MNDGNDVDGATARGVLDASLERALLIQLGDTWAEVNQNHFGGRLRRPVLALSDSIRRLGAWDGSTRTLSISRRLVLGRPWPAVREVLKHEIAHQFVGEILGAGEEAAHGPAFEAVCRQHGFDASATGVPEIDPGMGGPPPSPVLRRIARLLALADSPNVHEAEGAMKAAQRLMLQHNIDAGFAAAAEGFTFRHVGVPNGRVPASQHVLAGILSQHFFVEVIWVPAYSVRDGRTGRVLELCGTSSNLDVAVYVHGFLIETAERLWREHRRARGLRGNSERRRFHLGVMMGFDEKLKAAADDNRREGLVWVGDPALASYIARRYPRRTGGSGIGIHATEAYEHGRRAGRNIVLKRPIASGTGQRGRLLTGKT